MKWNEQEKKRNDKRVQTFSMTSCGHRKRNKTKTKINKKQAIREIVSYVKESKVRIYKSILRPTTSTYAAETRCDSVINIC